MEQEHHLYLIVRYEILGQKRRLSAQNLILASTGRQENSVHLLCTTLRPEVATTLCRNFLFANNFSMRLELFRDKVNDTGLIYYIWIFKVQSFIFQRRRFCYEDASFLVLPHTRFEYCNTDLYS